MWVVVWSVRDYMLGLNWLYGRAVGVVYWGVWYGVFFFQAEDGIRVLVRSRGLGDVYRDSQGTVLCSYRTEQL